MCEVLLANDPVLASAWDLPDALIAEVKEGAAELNRRLKTPEVVYVALRRIGCCPEEHIADSARAPLERGGSCSRTSTVWPAGSAWLHSAATSMRNTRRAC